MKRGSTPFILLILLAGVFGCQSRPAPIHRFERSYTLGSEVRAAAGTEFFKLSEDDTVYKRPLFGFLAFGPCAPVFSTDFVAVSHSTHHELLYNGRDADKLLISYRKTLWPPGGGHRTTTKQVKLDLARSQGLLEYRDYRIQVIEATSDAIRVVVLSDGQE